MTRLCIALLLLSATATAQPRSHSELPPPEPEPLLRAVGGARLRLSAGVMGLAIQGPAVDGFDTWADLGLGRPKLALRSDVELRFRLGHVLRLGVAGGMDWTRSTSDTLASGEPTSRHPIRIGFLEGVVMIGRTRHGGPSTLFDFGLRLAGGGGLATGRWEGVTARAAHYRVSAAFDASFLFGRGTANGLGVRIGWSHVRTSRLGPLERRYDLSGPFLDLGFVHGW